MKNLGPQVEEQKIIVGRTNANSQLKKLVEHKLDIGEVKVHDTAYGIQHVILEGNIKGFIRLKELARTNGIFLETGVKWEPARKKVTVNNEISREKFEEICELV